jgi:hypothetical protein
MKSETRLEEQSSESVLDPFVLPSPETAEAVAMADATARKLRKKRLDVNHLHREDKPLVRRVPPYEIRLFRKRPEPAYALYGPGPRTGKLPERSDKYLAQGSLMCVFRKMKDLLLADEIKDSDGSHAEFEKTITLTASYLEDHMIDALPPSIPDAKREETPRTMTDTLSKLGKAGDKPE